MAEKPTYEELEQRIQELEKKSFMQSHTEKAMLEREEKYRKLFHHSNDGIFIHDLEGNIIDINQKVIDYFDYTKPEMLATKIHLLHPPEALKKSKRAFETITRYGFVNFEIDFIRKNGEVFTAEVSSSLFKIGGKQVVQGIVRDITDRKKTEESLTESEKRYRAVVESQTEMICRFLPDGTLTFVNEAYCRYFDKGREELIGHKFMPLIPESDRDKVFENISSLNPNTPVITHEHRVFAPNGEICWHKWTNRAIFDDKNNLVEYQAVGWDITDQKLIQIALMESESELKIKAKDLEELNAALKVLLKKRQEDKEELEEDILSNVRTLIEPYIVKLNKSKLSQSQKTLLNILESNLNEIVSPFTRRLSTNYLNLTPTQIQVANLVKQGKTNKDIAEILNVSGRTIAFHRENIRKKFDLTNKKTNLKTHLMSIN
jgi:PAS domain S-box-containing protein